MIPSHASSRVSTDIDLAMTGRQIGDLRIRWSDNRCPLGHYPVPIVCIAGDSGPTVLLTGGVHGDEFEGPAALMRLAHSLSPNDVVGRIILLPTLNAAAVCESSRVSPLDGVNLNRAFPGDPDGGPMQMLADFVETVLLPECDAAIDLHSGGKASVFAPCTLAQLDGAQGAANLALAEAFGAPYLWVSGEGNDDRSLNAAASRQGVSMIAAELGGGGGCDPGMTDFAEAAVQRCLNHLGLTDLPVAAGAALETLRPEISLTAPASGLFDRRFAAGDRVEAGQLAGHLRFVDEPVREPLAVNFPSAGRVLAQTNRGHLARGELIALVAVPWSATTS